MAGALWAQLESWERSSGFEWTTGRLKMLKQILLGSVEVSDTSNLLKGPWGRLIISNTSLSGKLVLLSVYKKYILTEPSKIQLSKFYDSMEKPLDDGPSIERSVLTKDTALRLLKASYRSKPKLGRQLFTYLDHPFSNQKNLPFKEGSGDRKTFTEEDLRIDIEVGSNNLPLRKAIHDLPDACWKTDDERKFVTMALERFTRHDHGVIGSIQYIQEGGCKLRAIANPSRLAQWLLDPLKNVLLEMLKSFPSDCTFDQMKGVKTVQDRLKAGITCHCFDLSDATNNLPFKHLRNILESLGELVLDDLMEGDLSGSMLFSCMNAFMEFAKTDWMTPEGKIVSFTQGQPLGLGPSFPCLALQHHVILHECGASHNDYILLGDDVVIFNKTVAHRYEAAMGHYGVPISFSKTIISNVVAEFAGKVITRNSINSMYGWQAINATNCIDVLQHHGTKAMSWLPDHLVLPSWHVASLPRYMGGLGWTPPSHVELDPKIMMRLVDKAEREPLMIYASAYWRRKKSLVTMLKKIISFRQPWDTLSHSFAGLLRPWDDLDTPPHYVRMDMFNPSEEDLSMWVLTDNAKKASSSSLVRMALKEMK